MSTRRHAILFGINYHRTPNARLRGCINDIDNMAQVLIGPAYNFGVIQKFPDSDPNPRTTKRAILEELRQLAQRSHTDNLEIAWIHYSGHGCSQRDSKNGDETDKMDECLVPSDYNTGGLVRDDDIKKVLQTFNPATRVICIFDCCHSGTMGDLKHHYLDRKTMRIENKAPPCPAKVLMISGCMDKQTSADAYNVNQQRKFSGAMTSCLIRALADKNLHGQYKVFDLLDALRVKLRWRKFTQLPQLTSSFEIDSDERFF